MWRGIGVVACVLLLAAPAAADAKKKAKKGKKPPKVEFACRDSADVATRIDLADPAGAFGYFALPDRKPKGLVVYAHGHGNFAAKWQANVRQTAADLGVIAVAMNNRNQTWIKPDVESYGWRVREGAADSVAVARLFQRECKLTKQPIVMYGVSMGGNTSGLAVADGATRRDGKTPLFDYWFDIEGVTNVIETYFEARAVAGPPLNNGTGQIAVKEIEEEVAWIVGDKGAPGDGRTAFEDDPEAYYDLTVIKHAPAIKAAGVKGVVMVHGADDGSVGYNQSPEMFARLIEQGIPTDFFTVGRNGGQPAHDPGGTTLEDTLTLSGRIPGYTSPFTGHGGENDLAHPVIRLGYERLTELFRSDAAPCGFRKFLVDGTQTVPLGGSC